MTKDRSDIPENQKNFIHAYIDSVEQLQILLLLYESSNKAWSLSEITRQIRSAEASVQKRLDSLVQNQILEKSQDSFFSFHPKEPAVKDLVRELYEINKIRPHTVIETIYSRPADALRAFADAFKIKKDK